MSSRNPRPGTVRARPDIDDALETYVPTRMMDERYLPSYVDTEVFDFAGGVGTSHEETYHNGSYDVMGSILGNFAREHDPKNIPEFSLIIKNHPDEYITVPMAHDDNWQVDVSEDYLLEGDFDILGYSFFDSLSALSHDSETHRALQDLAPSTGETFEVCNEGLQAHIPEDRREGFVRNVEQNIERVKKHWYRQRGEILREEYLEPWEDPDRYRRREPDEVVDSALEEAGLGFKIRNKLYQKLGTDL